MCIAKFSLIVRWLFYIRFRYISFWGKDSLQRCLHRGGWLCHLLRNGRHREKAWFWQELTDITCGALVSDYSNGVRGFGRETACRLVKSAGDDSILDQILSDGVKATRKCKGKNNGINGNKFGVICPKTTTCEVGMSQDCDGQFRDVINAYLEPKCHSPDSEAVQRVCSQHPFLRSELQQICEKYFDWTPEKTDQYILPKIAERELRRFSNLRSTSSALGLKPLLSEIPVPCPVSAIVKQRKVHGSEHYEVSWRSIDGLQVSVVPGDLVRSACPEKITEFLENKGEEKKQKRRARPNKSAQAAVKDVDVQLQELLLGIESESGTFLPLTNRPQAADAHSVAASKDIVDLSSPSPPLRACKIAKSQKFVGSTTTVLNGIDLQCQSLLTGMMESQSSTQSNDAPKSTPDGDLIDLSSPLPPAANIPRSSQDLPPYNEAERRNLSDIGNFAEKGSISPDKHEAGTSGGGAQLEASTLVSHGTQMSSITDCSWRSDVQNTPVAEAATIDLCSPSPVAVGDEVLAWCDTRRRNKPHDADVIDICEADSSSDMSPDHERKARELRSFLDSIRDELY